MMNTHTHTHTHDSEPGSPTFDMSLVQFMVPRALHLQPSFQGSLARGDEEAAKGCCMIFTEMAISYLQLIMAQVGWLDGTTLAHMCVCGGGYRGRHGRHTHTHTHTFHISQEAYEQEKLVALVLACTAHPARDVNAYTLPFWYHLAVAFDT